MQRLVVSLAALTAAAGSCLGSIAVTPTLNPASLQSALVSDGSVNILSFSSSAKSFGGAMSTGIYNLSGTNAYGLERGGIVISTGDVAAYSSGPNTATDRTFNFANGGTTQGAGIGIPASASEEALLDPITGGGFTHYDVTQIDIQFQVNPGFTTVGFDVVFGSDEWAEFVGSTFVDGFGLYFNGVNIALADGLPININHPGMAAIAETELDGVLNSAQFGTVLRFQQNVVPGSINTLSFIVADTSDGVVDTTAYISGFGVPAPGAAGLLALGGLAAARRRRA